MLALIPIVLVSLFAVSCSRREDPPKKETKPEEPPPPKEVEYRRSCLNEPCAWGEKRASLYDYIGSTYGEAGKVQFVDPDGKQRLTVSESAYVEGAFGRLTGPEQVEPYLSSAHSYFLKHLGLREPRRCPQVPPVTLSHNRLGEGLILYGAHGCGEAHAKQLSQSGLELAMAAQPQGWTFFLEGQEPGAWLGDAGQPHEAEAEGKLLQRIATNLQIPLKEALKYNPSHPQVLEEAAKSSGSRREDFIVANVITLLMSRYSENPSQDQGLLLTQIVKEHAPYFRIDPDKLAVEVNDFLKKYKQDQGPEALKRMKILIETSNRLSGGVLKSELEALAEKSPPHKALFLVGLKHMEMVKGVYDK